MTIVTEICEILKRSVHLADFDKVGERINPLTHIRFPANQVDLT